MLFLRVPKFAPSMGVAAATVPFSKTSRALYSYGYAPNFYFGTQSLPVNTVIKFVPQQQAWIVERFGKFSRILDPGLAILFPFIDKIRYVKTLKEVAVEIPTQSAITQGTHYSAMRINVR